MISIYASKMFQNSPRKDKIKAALESPINIELVKQLEEYLDEEFIPAEPVHTEPKESAPTSDTNRPASKPKASPRAGGGYSSPSLAAKYNDKLDTEPASDIEPDTNESAADTTADTTSDVATDNNTEAAVHVNKQPVMSGTCIQLSSIVNDIKSILNIRAELAGVERVAFKGDDEIWVYYSDDINLNNIMSSVIETLNAGGFAYLEFNRLARSDNAIVFTFNAADTEAVVDPIAQEDE